MNRRTLKNGRNKHRGGDNKLNIEKYHPNTNKNSKDSDVALRNNIILGAGISILAIGGLTSYFAFVNK
jgi:hypothetical protein